jgi:Flp pilus assembly protein TadG
VRAPSRLRQRLGSTRGAALVELAASILVLMMVLVFTTDFARVYHHVIDLENAARAGAQFGATSLDNANNSAGMVSAAQAAAPGTALFATAAKNCYCASDDGTTTFYTPANCTDECPDATPEQHLVVKVTVNATYTFQTFAKIAGIPNSLTITRTATLRAQ